MVKKYKHKLTGKIFSERDTFYIGSEGNLPKWVVENSVDWEEVKEKDYEIMSYECLHPDGSSVVENRQIFVKLPNGNYKWSNCENTEAYIQQSLWNNKSGGHVIHSIKRLSDGEVFTLGDRVIYTGKSSYADYTIGDFFVKEDTVLVRSSGFGICEYLKDIKKVKQPLFITDDGKEIFDGDVFYCTNNKYDGETWRIMKVEVSGTINPHVYKNSFSTKEAAQKWIDLHKPKYSEQDMIDFGLRIIMMP